MESKKNWRKYLIYDFMNWVQDYLNEDEGILCNNTMLNLDNDTLEELIDNYITSCYYEYESYKDTEKYTLEDMEQLLKNLFLDREGN